MRFLSALAIALSAMIGPATAQTDDFKRLQACVDSADSGCLKAAGVQLAKSLKNPRDKSLMLARFALIDWASGNRADGNTQLFNAWSHLAEVPNDGCLPRVEATFAFENLTALFGNEAASRLVLRQLVRQMSAAPQTAAPSCSRPADEPNWIARVAARQRALGDGEGLKATLDLASKWGMDPAKAKSDIGVRPYEAAEVLAANGRSSEAVRICDANRKLVLGGLAAEATAVDRTDAEWQALACYRAAGLEDAARATYRDFAQAKLDAMGLSAAPPAGGNDDAEFGLALWTLVQGMSWNDAAFSTAPVETVPGARDCFMQPSAQCLAVHATAYVDNHRRGVVRKVSYGTAPDLKADGALDGFAQFLVGAGGDAVGDQARAWFLTQSRETPLENLRAVVGKAADAGDLIWARRIFYSWYTEGGEEYFHHLTDPDEAEIAKATVEEESWPLHVAWSIALIVNELHPAFEPEELASFAETAWDDGIAQLPALRSIPTTELIDADERSGARLLDLCFRDAFGEWAAKLFTNAHLPERATQARAVLPEAARDCAFARRSVGPILRTGLWFARQGDRAQARALMLEAADRLTRPHYHVYEDADPALGGSALAAMALGMQRGLLVPPPYDSAF